jgi:hypothetical protein
MGEIGNFAVYKGYRAFYKYLNEEKVLQKELE